MDIAAELATPSSQLNCIDRCVPNGLKLPIEIYILATIAGVDPTPATLMESASQFYHQIPAGLQDQVQAYLLCQIADNAGA